MKTFKEEFNRQPTKEDYRIQTHCVGALLDSLKSDHLPKEELKALHESMVEHDKIQALR